MPKAKLPSVVTLLILTMITTIMWVGFSIYRAFTEAPAPTVPQEISAPLNPTLNSDAINSVESAIYFDQSQVPAISATTPTPAAIATPAPTVSPTTAPIATPTGTPLASPTP